MAGLQPYVLVSALDRGLSGVYRVRLFPTISVTVTTAKWRTVSFIGRISAAMLPSRGAGLEVHARLGRRVGRLLALFNVVARVRMPSFLAHPLLLRFFVPGTIE